jgi:hypothetical protein
MSSEVFPRVAVAHGGIARIFQSSASSPAQPDLLNFLRPGKMRIWGVL